MSVSINGTSGIVFNDGTTQATVAYSPWRNRIINGDMRIDQRNAGASVTVNNNSYIYSVDRWAGLGQPTDGVFTLQRATVAPTGFSNSLLATVTTADTSLGASQFYVVRQAIEGFNIADLGWGAAGAQAVTLSFWVRSSLTGTFGGSLRNAVPNRSYPFTYSINAVNTWEQKTISIAGDTSGTWDSTNGEGINLFFGLGVGSSFSGAAGAWAGANYLSATGAQSVVGTNGATFYITGVQLEAGTTATPFERVEYGEMERRCRRYFQPLFMGLGGISQNGISQRVTYNLSPPMRATPTLSAVTSLETTNAGTSLVGAVDNQQIIYIATPTSTSFIKRDSCTASAEL